MFQVSKLNRPESNMNSLTLCGVRESGQKTQNCHPYIGMVIPIG